MNKEKTLEEKFERLRQITQELKEDIKLQDSMQLYREGKDIVAECEEELQKIEGELKILQNNE